jgi:MFS family permease
MKKRSIFAYPRLTPLWVAVFIDILGFSILIPYLPFFSEEFGAPPWQVGLLLSTNALFGFFSGPIWGGLSDVHGRKPTLLLSQLGTLAGFLILAFSDSLTLLFLSRIVDGIFGGNYPIARAIIGDVVPAEDRSKQMSNTGVAHVLASLIGPGLGGLLSGWGILAPGLAAATMTTVAILLTFFLVEETNPVVTEELPAAEEVEVLPRLGPRNIWRNRTARFYLTLWAFHTLSFFLYISCVSLFANLKLGLDAREVGLVLMLSGGVRVFNRFFVLVPLLNYLGDRRTLLLGLGIFVAVFFALGFVSTPVQFAGALIGVSFAAGCTRGILNSFMSRSVKPWEQGTVMGVSSSLDSFAQIVGPLLGGVVLGYLPLWTYGALAGTFALAAFALGVWHFIVRRGKNSRLAPSTLSEKPA